MDCGRLGIVAGGASYRSARRFPLPCTGFTARAIAGLHVLPRPREDIPRNPQAYPPVPRRMRLISSLTWSKIVWRSVIRPFTFSTACMTVVWSRPPNCSAILRVAVVGQLAEDVHADLAGDDERPAPALAAELVDREPEHLRRSRRGSAAGVMTRGRGRRQQVGEHVAGDLLGERRAVQAGVGRDPDQRALELADVVARCCSR